MHNPLLTIVTINFNNSNGLKKTIQSVVDQTSTSFEFVVIDGASTDSSVSVIKQFADRIDFWTSESDFGIYDAMNKGIRKSNGNYVCFLNSGDYFASSESVNIIVSMIISTNSDLIYCDTNIVNTDGTTLFTRVHGVVDNITLLQAMINHQSLFVKRNLFDKYGLFDLSFKIKADHDWLIRIARSKPRVTYLPKILVCYEEGGLSDRLRKLVPMERRRIVRRHTTFIGMMLYRLYSRVGFFKEVIMLRRMINHLILKKIK